MGLRTSRVRHRFKDCLEPRGAIKKKGDLRWAEAKDARYSLGCGFVCVLMCSQLVAID